MQPISAGLLVLVSLFADDAPPESPTPRMRYETLLHQFEDAEKTWHARYDARPGNVAEADSVERYLAWPAWDFAPRFRELAEANPDDPVAIDAWLWIVGLGRAVSEHDKALLPHYTRALEFLASHLQDERIGPELCRSMSSDLSPRAEAFLRLVIEKGRDRETRATASLGLARHLVVRREVALNPWFDKKTLTRFDTFVIGRHDPAYFRSIRESDPKALYDEAGSQFESVAREYGDVDAFTLGHRVWTFGDVARAELHELRFLAVGQVAPEIEGTDVEGRTFRLSEYRGKVVMLTFSGNWCGPCRAMYPNERALIERHKDEPFALVSVNTDETKATLKASIDAGEITWRCWWDGEIVGPICARWNVSSFPMIYLLDDQGVIRSKGIRDKELDGAVTDLLKTVKR